MSKPAKSLRELPYTAAASLINLPFGSLGSGADDPNAILPLVANRIADIMAALAYPLAFVGIIYSVYLLIVNSGNADALKTTKKNIGYIAGGIFLLVFTAIILNFFARIFR
jgi:hypothetical protein